MGAYILLLGISWFCALYVIINSIRDKFKYEDEVAKSLKKRAKWLSMVPFFYNLVMFLLLFVGNLPSLEGDKIAWLLLSVVVYMAIGSMTVGWALSAVGLTFSIACFLKKLSDRRRTIVYIIASILSFLASLGLTVYVFVDLIPELLA